MEMPGRTSEHKNAMMIGFGVKGFGSDGRTSLRTSEPRGGNLELAQGSEQLVTSGFPSSWFEESGVGVGLERQGSDPMITSLG
eukprot:751123-Hanusia_phi.AAC.1